MRQATALLVPAVVSILCTCSLAGEQVDVLWQRSSTDNWLASSSRYAAADVVLGSAGDAGATRAAPASSTTQSLIAPTAGGARNDELAYVPWPQRRGPAYPGKFWLSMDRDLREIPETVWDDTKAVFTDPVPLIGIGIAGLAGIAINASGADDSIARQTLAEGGELNHFWDSAFDAAGNPGTHFAIAGVMYLVSLANGDTKTYEVSKTMINALAINGIVTLALKGAVRTHSPNGDPIGWPSGHTSSSFAFATVMAQEYGPAVGVPMYAAAAMVGFERVDARNHDLSDVVSGAIIGTVIGYAVDKNHKGKIMGMDVVPIVSGDGGLGVGLSKRF